MASTPLHRVAASLLDKNKDAVRPWDLPTAELAAEPCEEFPDENDDNVEVPNVVKEGLMEESPGRSPTQRRELLRKRASAFTELESKSVSRGGSEARAPQMRCLPFPRRKVLDERLVPGEAGMSGWSAHTENDDNPSDRQSKVASGTRDSALQGLLSSYEQVLTAPADSIPTHLVPDCYRGVGNPERNVLKTRSRKGRPDVHVTAEDLREWWRSWEPSMDVAHSPLHQNIAQFCHDHELQPLDLKLRAEALAFVKDAVRKTWPMADVDSQVFGSSATGLALPCSDVDIALLSSSSCDIESWQERLKRQLELLGVCQSFMPIFHTRVPLLKVEFKSGVACDISMNAPYGPRAVPMIQSFMEEFEALRPLSLVLKHFLGLQELNQLSTGALSSFCLITVVFSHLRELGVVGRGNDLGALLVSFFMRYTDVHNYSTDVVSATSDAHVSRIMKGWVKSKSHSFAVEDPMDPLNNLAKGSSKIREIRALFSQARTILLHHWHEKDVLSHLMTMPRVGRQQKRWQHQEIVKDQKAGFSEASNIGRDVGELQHGGRSGNRNLQELQQGGV